jgi:uncharacterized RDD family membrane protein YckC
VTDPAGTAAGDRGHAVRYVGFWARVFASLVDTVLLSMLVWPLLTWIYGSEYWAHYAAILGDPLRALEPAPAGGPAETLVSWVLPAVAVIAFWIARQATPGKMLIGARIVDAATLGPLTRRQAVVRYLGYYVSMFGLFLGFLWVGWDPRKQGWHDKLAGTVVIRARGPGTPLH